MSLVVEREPLDLATLPDTLRKHLDPGAPPPLKLMAARGMLPVSPEQNIQLLYHLATQGDEQTSAEAEKSIGDMPPDILLPAVAKVEHLGALDWLAEKKAKAPAILEAIVTNRGAHDRTIARIARNADANLCDVIATNQVRILGAPVILEQLYQNANARMATVDRLLELVQREGVELSGLPGVQSLLSAGQKVFADAGEADPGADALLAKEAKRADEEAKKYANLDDLPRSERDKLMEDDEEEDQRRSSGMLSDQIQRLGISGKVRLATVGSREALNILVRDPNKLVHMAAVRSPRAQDIDFRRWARNKTLPDGVIAHIANQRDLTRHYDVMLALCQNPKTPLADTMKFLNHIRNNDLKQLARDRNVSMQVSRQAKNLEKKRSGR